MLVCLFVLSVTLPMLAFGSAIGSWLQAEHDYDHAFRQRERRRSRCLANSAKVVTRSHSPIASSRMPPTDDIGRGHWHTLLLEQLAVIDDVRDGSLVIATRME